MARPKGSKNKKQFCPQGHDINIVGRDKSGHCRECKAIFQKRYIILNKDRTKERKHRWYLKNRNKILRHSEKYRKRHRKERTVKQREYRHKYPELYKAFKVKFQGKRGLRVPKFGQWGIISFYKKCPKGKQVDHYIPLVGDLVSGLHVSWNLQYLTPKQNRSKSNSVDLTEASEWYDKILEEAGLHNDLISKDLE